jgi:hypothetical protein
MLWTMAPPGICGHRERLKSAITFAVKSLQVWSFQRPSGRRIEGRPTAVDVAFQPAAQLRGQS